MKKKSLTFIPPLIVTSVEYLYVAASEAVTTLVCCELVRLHNRREHSLLFSIKFFLCTTESL